MTRLRRAWASALVSLSLLIPAPALADAEPSEESTGDAGGDPGWTGTEGHQRTDPAHGGSVDSDGSVTVGVLAPGSEQEPAVRASFDPQGNAKVEVVLAPVRIREIDRVPDDLRDTEPNFQGACIRTRTIMVPPENVAATRYAYEEILIYTIRAVFPTETPDIPACTPRPGDDEADGGEIAGVLEAFVEQLPRPTPVLNPSKAVTGLDTYLQTNRPLAYGPVTLTGGPFVVTLEAVGAYTVDWGQEDDGPGEAFRRVSGPHVIPGRNYESGRSPDDGAVTHVYTSTPAGPLEVSVTDYWTIQYSISLAASGTTVVDGATLVAELAPVSVPVEVREYQAVVVSQ